MLVVTSRLFYDFSNLDVQNITVLIEWMEKDILKVEKYNKNIRKHKEQ